MINETYVLIGIIISLICERLPKFKDWFATLTPQDKQLLIIGLTILSVLIVNGLGCAGIGNASCLGWESLGDAIIVWGSSQLTHLGTKEILNDGN